MLIVINLSKLIRQYSLSLSFDSPFSKPQVARFPLGVLSPHGRALTLYLPWSRLSTLTSHLSGKPFGCGLEEEKK
ncbi:hypothetical protein Syun_007154 [Stephania yunnanensis]|uniref:Uncharacterized protein n=1 Tax=Stephania yunnanensis TaxID=152371 RepID=A0AAP0KY07_9MAGN